MSICFEICFLHMQVVSACHSPPVATSALLTYEICKELHPDIASECGYLCAIGTHGDLGNTLKWNPPFPDMAETFKTHTKKLVNECVSFLNARRFTLQIYSDWALIFHSTTNRYI